MGATGQNPGSPGFALPRDEAEQVRRTRDIEREIEEMLADGTLRALIDSLPASIAAIIATAVSTTTLTVSGNATVGGTITGGGDIRSSGGYLVSPAGPAFDITTGRTAAWWRNSDGRLAFASSSREKKTNIRDSDVDPLAVMDLAVRAFNYRAEVAKRDDPDYPEYEGPEYHVALEFGLIAEEAHDLGLWQVVIYKDHWKPIGIHYELLGLLAVKATQHVWQSHLEERRERLALSRRVEALEVLLGVQGL